MWFPNTNNIIQLLISYVWLKYDLTGLNKYVRFWQKLKLNKMQYNIIIVDFIHYIFVLVIIFNPMI